MSTTTELRDDLNFVAGALRRNRSPGVPAILLLWALLIPIGFSLADFAPRSVGLFWLVAGPGGALLSFWLGHSAARATGMVDRSIGRRHGLHWLTLGIAYALFAATIATGRMDATATAPIWLLLTAMAYAMGGAHMEDSRGLLPAGAIMFAGYAALAWLPLPYPWTATGLIVSLALVVAALKSRRAAPRA